MNKKQIAAVVVTYNREALLKECIEALFASKYDTEKYELFVYAVNNASTDGTAQLLNKLPDKYSNLIVINQTENTGGAGGFFKGMNDACIDGRDYLWLMDDDTVVREDSLDELLKAAEILKDDFGYLSSVALWTDGTPCKMNHHAIMKNWAEKKQLLQYGLVSLEVATFVSFFMKAELVKKLGLPYRQYFIWGDDTEYSLRISATYPCYICGHSVVTHKMQRNETARNLREEDDKDRIERRYYSYRNDYYTYRFQNKRRKAFFLFWFAKEYYRILFGRHVAYKGLKLKVLRRAARDGRRFVPQIEYPEK